MKFQRMILFFFFFFELRLNLIKVLFNYKILLANAEPIKFETETEP